MRSNGAGHLGHDTFVGLTRDSGDSLYLFTSSFTPDERLAELPLSRRARFFPASSLDLSEEDMNRCLEAFDRLEARRAAAQQRPGTATRVFDIPNAAGAAAAGKMVTVAPSPKSSSAEQPEVATDAEMAALTRHSVHISCDGQRLAAISTRHRQHYVLDLAHNPVNVAELETEELVRSAAWHPSNPHLLLTLSVTGVLCVYDACVAHLNVVFQRAQQTDLKPMLNVVLRDKGLRALASLRNDAASTGSRSAPPEGHDADTEEAARGGSAQASGAASALSTTPSRTSRRDPTSSPPPAPSAAAPTNNAGHDATSLRVSSLLKGGKRNTTSLYTLGEMGLPMKATARPAGPHSPRASAPSAAAATASGAKAGKSAEDAGGLLAEINAAFSSRKGTSSLRRPPAAAIASAAAAAQSVSVPRGDSSAAAAGSGKHEDGAEEENSEAALGLSRVSATVYRGATGHQGRHTLHAPPTAAPPVKPALSSALQPTTLTTTSPAMAPGTRGKAILTSAAEARALVPLHHHDPTTCPTSTSIDLVDMCVVAASASLPPTLLLLSSSGDVFSVKLNPYCLPAMGKSVASDGSVPLTRAEAEAAAELQKARDRMPHLCHVIQGVSHVETVPAEGASRASSSDLVKDPEEERAGEDDDADEAVAVRCCRLDDDTGLHAVIVVYATGVVRGAWVDEADLIARHRVSSVTQDFAKYGASSFKIHLGASLAARTYLSPPVPSTTHTLQVSAQGNVLLLRSGGGEAQNEAAYLIAFPVLDRARKGWSYWRPGKAQVPDAAERAREALRLPIVSTDTAVPEPLAVRVPLDVHGASLALGATEVMLFPETAGGTDGPRRTVITAKIPSLLRAALYARAAGVALVPQSWADSPAAGTSSHIKALGEKMFECHKVWLCGCPAADVDACTAQLASMVEKELAATKQHEAAVQKREAAVKARMEALQRRMTGVAASVDAWTVTLLDAIAHRRGPEAVHTANQRLGLAHDILTEQEEEVANWRRRRQASPRPHTL